MPELMTESMKLIFEALEKKECLVLNNFVTVDSPGNSVVYAISNPISIDFFAACISHFSKLYGKSRELNFSDFKIGLNVVRISGNKIAEEGLHVHLSHIIAIVFEGEGILECESKEGNRHTIAAKQNDCVVIPRGALHYFTGKLSFSALEFSDIIDYQKHHYTSIDE